MGNYVSAGSACSSNKPEVSGTLKGIGLTKEYYESTLRFSFSIFNTVEEVDICVEALKRTVADASEIYKTIKQLEHNVLSESF